MKFKWILILIFSLFLTACQEQTTTIIFDTNGGSVIPDILLTDQQRQDELPIPEKENYLFKGWFLDAEMTTPLEDSDFETLTTFQEVILYAKWERAFYILTTHVFIELDEVITTLALGVNHSAVLTSSGRLMMWGFNQFGQLGNGTTINKNNTQHQPFYLIESIEETRVASPYVIPFPLVENMLWYDSFSFSQQLVFPLTLTSDTTIYAKPQKP